MAGEPMLTEYSEVQEIAKKLNATPAQVLIAWGAKRGYSVIPKSVTPCTLSLSAVYTLTWLNLSRTARIESNFQQVEISDEDYEKLCDLGRKKRRRYNIKTTYPPYWDIDIFGEPEESSTANKIKIV